MRLNPALDALVAEKVLGGKKTDSAPRFSSDLAAAWEIVDHVCDQGYRLQLDGKKLWQARFYKSVAHTLETRAELASGSSPAEAICLAALALQGVGPPASRY